jgi:metal-responsive CopG/Arc/MetJ family transcriptional regulator
MGLPNLAHKVCMITVGVQGEPERISAMAGKLGRLKGCKVKSAVSDLNID